MSKNKVFEKALEQFKENTGVIKNNKKYMDFMTEIKRIEAVAAKKHPLVKEYINYHREAEKRQNTLIGRMAKEMRNIAAKQEVFKIAAEMCKNKEDRDKLLNQVEALNNSPAMNAYENYINGLKYLAGMTNEIKPEVSKFFEDELHVPLLKDHEEYEKFRQVELKKLDEDLQREGKNVKAEVMDQYRKLVARTKARELFSKRNVDFMAIERQFIGDYTSKKGAVATDPYNNRMTPTAFCMARMLLNGYRLEDIFDPRALLEEKKKVGQEYIDRREKKDTTWYANEMYKGAEAAMKAFHKYISDYKKELKTEDDLAMHSNNLARLSTLCFDLYQELNRAKSYSDKTFKTEADMVNLGSKIEKYQIGGGTATSTSIVYDPSMLCSTFLSMEIQRQMSTKLLLNEIQKENPDLDSILLGPSDKAALNNQLELIEDIKSMFDKNDDFDFENMDTPKLKTLVSMMSTEYVEKNNLKYVLPKKPVYVKNAPDKSFYKNGTKLEIVLSAHNKQIIETNIPAKMDEFFKGMENKDFRGKEKNNSPEFNQMMKAYDQIIEKFGAGELKNAEYIDEMKKLKTAANAYISAKRDQKGYSSSKLSDKTINAKMLGLEKGSGIFSAQGKDRYEFAINLVSNIDNLETEFKHLAKQEAELENDGMDMNK